MSEQFPGDTSGGDRSPVFHIVYATLDPKQSSEYADRATSVLEDVVDKLEGFMEGRVFKADDRKTVII